MVRSVAEARHRDTAGTQRRNPVGAVAVHATDEADIVAAGLRRAWLRKRRPGRRPLRQQHIVEAARRRRFRRHAVSGDVEIDMAGEKPRGLPEFPGIVGAPVDDERRTIGADQIEGLEPDLVVHQHTEDHVRTKAGHPFEQGAIEVGEIIE